MNYKFIYKKDNSWFWKTKIVKGHSIETDRNGSLTGGMTLYYPDGSIERIANWQNYNLKLGTDWLLACKEQAEREAQKKIQLEEGIGNGN